VGESLRIVRVVGGCLCYGACAGGGCACAGGRVVSVASALRREVHCNILVVLVCPI